MWEKGEKELNKAMNVVNLMKKVYKIGKLVKQKGIGNFQDCSSDDLMVDSSEEERKKKKQLQKNRKT